MFDTGMWTASLSSTCPTIAGDLDGLHIRHDGDPIPVTVHVEWTDGGEGEIDGWTKQWTRTHVSIVRSLQPGRFRPFWVRASDVRRREI